MNIEVSSLAGVIELALGHATREALGLAFARAPDDGDCAAFSLQECFARLLRTDQSDDVFQREAGGHVEVTRTTGLLPRWFNRPLLPNVGERAFFYFILTMLRRNRQLKLQVYL